VQGTIEALNAAWQAASQDIYAQQQAQAQGQPNPGAQQGGETTQPEDVEFEEVK
jgi:molecular chaperone DnaK